MHWFYHQVTLLSHTTFYVSVNVTTYFTQGFLDCNNFIVSTTESMDCPCREMVRLLMKPNPAHVTSKDIKNRNWVIEINSAEAFLEDTALQPCAVLMTSRVLTNAGSISLKTSKASIWATHRVLHKFTSFVLLAVPTGKFSICSCCLWEVVEKDANFLHNSTCSELPLCYRPATTHRFSTCDTQWTYNALEV